MACFDLLVCIVHAALLTIVFCLVHVKLNVVVQLLDYLLQRLHSEEFGCGDMCRKTTRNERLLE